MNDQTSQIEKESSWWKAMFRDIQFWVPLAILVVGLILLSIIQ